MCSFKSVLAVVAATAILAACAEREERLPGERLEIRAPATASAIAAADAAAAQPAAAPPFRAPRQVANANWTHRGGDADKSVAHPALSAQPSQIWSTPVGQGNSRRHRITADPVVADGRIFTLDSRSTVTAVSTSGAVLWSRDLTPLGENADHASGGGLAVSGGRLFVTTGFGRLVALNAETGAELWVQRKNASATTAPTVFGNTVYSVSRDSRAWAVDAATGRVRWEIPGIPTQASVLGAAGPGVTSRLAVFPLPSGELVATLRQSGLQVWAASLSGGREGRVYARINDITADPVFADGRIYTGNATGRTIALNAASGERIWTANDGAMSPVQVAGGSVFLISDQNQLVRLNAADGARIWAVPLPLFVNQRERRRNEIFAHFGPILAGGRLYVASSDDTIRIFDPSTGAQTGALALPGGAAAIPAVANGTLYVVSGRGTLHAFR
ncbi:MAG: PQQ-binding-like beta-propeller repeat protein [Pseudomonadota bacterium]